MELTIKHLAPYLPYGLELKFVSKHEVDRLSKNDIIILKEINEGSICVNGYKSNNKSYLPILRPLSKFGSDDIIQIKEHLGLGRWCDAYDQYFDVWFDDVANVDKLILQCPYEIIQFFLENHFDVFGLIDAGLAIEMEDSHGG